MPELPEVETIALQPLHATVHSHALQAEPQDLALRGVYTWSKTLDDGDSLNATTSGGQPALASNPFNLRADWGLGNFDVRHAAAISGVYELPFGRGKRFLHDASGLADALPNWEAM